MEIDEATVLWIETGAMQGEDRYILEIPEHLASYFEEKGEKDTIPIHHQGDISLRNEFKYHDSEHYSPQWRIFLPTGFAAFSQTYYPDNIAHFEKGKVDTRWYTGQCYYLELRTPSHSKVDAWREKAAKNGVKGHLGQADDGREYGYY